MGNMKDKFLAKIENGGNKKSIENLVVFVIILIATIIFINYIWNGDRKNDENKSQNVNIADTTNTVISSNNETNNTLEKQLEDILKRLEGVEDVKVLITYSETNKVIPMYNEDNTQSTTKEEDNRRGC